MTRDSQFTDLLTDWLEDQPHRAPGRLLEVVLSDLQSAPQDTPWRRVGRHPGIGADGSRARRWPALERQTWMVVAGAAAILIVVGGAVGMDLLANQSAGIGAQSPSLTASPAPTPTSPAPAGAMWPQASLTEAHAAQARADAGDPDYTWQVDAQLSGDIAGDIAGGWERLSNGEVEIVDRFLREVLGWEDYIQNRFEGGTDHSLADQRFLRCAPGRTNPLYPPQPGVDQPGTSCAPTLDGLTYESVSLDLVQPDRKGPGGIWVVNEWRRMPPFQQADPADAEAAATARLERFLDARIAGRGAEGYVDVWADWLVQQVPLLYATTSGARYERYEYERVSGPTWPFGGDIVFRVRLFADGDASLVEQEIRSHWDGGGSVGIRGGLGIASTSIENGRPVPMRFGQFGGEVIYASPSGNQMDFTEGGPRDAGFIDFTDPAVYWSECAGGPVPADAAAFAKAVSADPNFVTTAPVAARVGGIDALAVDVVLSPSGRVCPAYRTDGHRWIHALIPGMRLRLFLVDVPKGMSMRTLAITVLAAEDQFEGAVAAARPILDSIEFHPRGGGG